MINSWDCFDTLISRYYHQPISTFYIIAKKINDPSFIKKRIAAEKEAHDKTLEGIYERLPGYSAELEIETEIENTYPIKENFDRIKDNDIIVSDMYLSSEQILRILRSHGLDRDVRVISTYGGKATGGVWDTIDINNINLHTGDNLKSDIVMSRNFNIRSIYYGGASLTNQEKFIERYCPYLAYWTKYNRLNNPYFVPKKQFLYDKGSISYYYSTFWLLENNKQISILNQINHTNNSLILYDKNNNITYTIHDENIIIEYQDSMQKQTIQGEWIEQPTNTNRFDEHLLWSEQCSYNIPLLISVAYNLPKNIIFSYRDCFFLKKIYDSIFTTNIPILDSCRDSYYNPYNQEYIDYVLNITKSKTIIDLHGSGWSSDAFFNKYREQRQNILFVSEHAEEMKKNIDIKNFSMCFDRVFDDDPLINDFHHNRFASMRGLRCCSGTMLEKFNIPPEIGPLIGWCGTPIRQKSEHNQAICNIFNKAVETACGVSKKYNSEISSIDEEIIVPLLQKMNNDNYTNTVVHSLWKKSKNIRIN